ncbi:hypothetical protein C8J57DRAFT_1492646 [Mycena rebaudengoi]|nr:hypothetical protein C8J57DRAFT_1492646 [Mycena rebaudengoi]
MSPLSRLRKGLAVLKECAKQRRDDLPQCLGRKEKISTADELWLDHDANHEREKNGGDDDEEGDPKPSRKEALQAVSTLHQYIADLDEPFARNLEGVLATFGSIADGLLIYRCYVVWNHDWHVIVLPVMLLIASTGEACRLDVFLNAIPQFAVILATNFLATGLTGKSISWPLETRW